jgi:hypothetical protein
MAHKIFVKKEIIVDEHDPNYCSPACPAIAGREGAGPWCRLFAAAPVPADHNPLMRRRLFACKRAEVQ